MSLRSRWIYRTLSSLLVVSVVFGMLGTQTASALDCDNWYGRNCWYGYFGNDFQDENGADVLIGGIPDIPDNGKQIFIDKILEHLGSGDAQRVTAAQFIILSMSGYDGGVAKSVSQTQIDDWKDRVNNPEVTLRAEDVKFDCNIANSFYQTNHNDVAAGYSTPSEGCGNIDAMIDFYHNGALVYRIRVACANPLGRLPGLPKISPTVVSCGSLIDVSPRNPEVGQATTVTVTVSFSGGPPTPVPTNPKINILNTPGDVGIASTTRSGGTFTMVSVPFSEGSVGQYSVQWALDVNGVSSGNCGGTFNRPGDSFDVMRYPFFSAKGGDVAAGASFATSDAARPCGVAQSNPNAGMTSWNQNAGPYSGAGGEYGTFAMNFIQGFVTSQGNGKPPSSLAFANTGTSGGIYGGFFGRGPCVNYWSKRPTSGPIIAANTINPNSLATNVYRRTGPLTIDSGVIAQNRHVTIYVEGNVYIRGNITYQNGGAGNWASLASIPVFKLIVHGTIFVDQSVTQLDGTYVAVPDPGYLSAGNSLASPISGTISTCSTGFASRNPSSPPASATISGCNRQLVVNGTFAANQLFLLRTNNTRGDGVPAEIFNYGPENWIAPGDNTHLDPTYQSIMALPPVL
jgi:hypothetical protein